MKDSIPFVRPTLAGSELAYLSEVLKSSAMAGDGPFTKRCHEILRDKHAVAGALLTHSCTAALEMAALICNLQPGDEVIMPSFTFVSTANAVVLRGAIPVFIDIRPDTLNMNEKLLEAAITKKTKAIIPVHYAGVSCQMDAILQTARNNGLKVIEDAAQGYGASFKGQALGTIGDFGTLSFHQTKNVIAGEGGALYVKLPEDMRRAEIIREKGTDRSLFLRGEVDKYCWRDIGSSFLPSELTAAFLLAQLEGADQITFARLRLWQQYHNAFLTYGQQVGLPKIPKDCEHNAHIYYLILPSPTAAIQFVQFMREKGIQCTSHYVPLHSSPGGIKFGRFVGNMEVTNRIASTLVRLPLWQGLESSMKRVIEAVEAFIEKELPHRGTKDVL